MPKKTTFEFESQTSEEMFRELSEVEEMGPKAPKKLNRMDPYGPFEGEMTRERAVSMMSSNADMEDVSNDGRYINAPNLPKPPTFSGFSTKEKRDFKLKYEAYYKQLLAFENAQSRPFLKPIWACIDPWVREHIAQFEFGKEAHAVTDYDWIQYFKDADVAENKDLRPLDNAMAKIKLDTTLPDATSMMAGLVMKVYKTMDEYGLKAYVQEADSKRIVRYITDALEPPAFKTRILDRLGQEMYKRYRKDPVAVKKWITDDLRNYLEYAQESRMENPKPVKKPDQKKDGKAGATRPGKQDASASHNTPEQAKTQGEKKKKRLECLKCGSFDHLVRQCPKLQAGEAEKLLEQKGYRSGAQVNVVKDLTEQVGATLDRSTGLVKATLEKCVAVEVLLDSGADVSLISGGLMKRLEEEAEFLRVKKLSKPKVVGTAGKDVLSIRRSICLESVVFQTSAGPLVWRNVWCMVDDGDERISLIINRETMEQMGYSPDALLVEAKRRMDREENLVQTEEQPVSDALPFIRLLRIKEEARLREDMDGDVDQFEEKLLTPEISPADQQQDQIKEILTKKVQEAIAAGLVAEDAQRLESMLEEYRDVFRIEFANDPPIKVEPMKVNIKPDALPVMCKSRRYPPLHRQFLRDHMEDLEEHDLVERNPEAIWGSAPRIVPKKDGTLRMTVDLRAVNEATIPRSWPMPHQEAEMSDVEGSTCFFGADCFRFYWQCGTDGKSRLYFSIVTPHGIYTPSRVLMGATDAVAYCQQAVEQVMGPLLNRGVKVWLDDILGYAKDEKQLLDRLEEMLKRCFKFDVKLHPSKCDFFLKIVKWCGRIISGAGVGHCPDRIRGLVEMPPPTMASELQQFLCACNWMRASMPGYNALVEPLTTLMEVCMSKAGSRKKAKLTSVLLTENGWSQVHLEALEALKKALLAMVPLAHPKDNMEVCVYTDASQDHWGAIVTQVVPGELSKPLKDQNHQPLAFLSGSFKGSSSRWPIVEKEAFAIVETCKRLEYLLLRENGFHLYTDHRNLQYIFKPTSDAGTMARYQADKLQRWSMVLRMFRYKIEHVPGEDNVWGDMLSRWGATDIQPDCQVKRLVALKQACPLEQEDFVWPTLKEIRDIQVANGLSDVDLWKDASSGCFKNEDGKMVIPEDADDLKMRLCVVAHAGRAGHRGINTTIKSLQGLYFWVNMAEDVKAFIKDCLHCIVVGGSRVPRPLGSTVVATKPNEVLHMDFLKLPLSTDGFCYVLVIKDGMSGFSEFIPCRGCTAEDALHALNDWFKRYGPVFLWVTDQGSHFKNRAITALQKVWGVEHHFVTAYCPWANGSVEVVNRVLLKALKTMLSELKLKVVDWTKVIASVQASMNFSPSSRLGSIAPITAFLGLPAPSPLKTSLVEYPVNGLPTVEAVTWSLEVLQHVAELQESLDQVHKKVVSKSAMKNARERKRRQGQSSLPNLDVGDFVLVGRAVEVPNKLALQWRGPCRVVNALSK